VNTLPDPVIPEATDAAKQTKKRSRAEADTTSKSKKKRTDQNDDSGDSEEKDTKKKKPEVEKAEIEEAAMPEKETQAAPDNSQLDDIDPFDYPFDATPIQSLTKNNKKAAPATKGKPAPASIPSKPSKPSRAVKAKVKYVEIASDDDDGDAYNNDSD
jgi:hypothetical protein